MNFLYQKASELGCILDCNLATGAKIGGGTATDNTAILNAFLGQASATVTPVLVLDGPTICTGIQIPQGASASILGLGKWTGFYIKTGSNAHIITNAVSIPFTPTGSPPTPAGKLLFRDFYLNGNRGNGTTGDSTSGDPRGITGTIWYCGIDVVNAASCILEDVEFYDIPTYSHRNTNCFYTKVSGVVVTSPSNAFNTDALHFNGPNYNIAISDCPELQSGDDAIALNAPEGYGGNIANVKITNCNVNANNLMRAYSIISTQYAVSNIAVSNCGGSVNQAVFLFGAGSPGSTLDAIQDFTACNHHFTIAAGGNYVQTTDNLGVMSFENCIWDSPIGATAFLQSSGAVTISSMEIQGKIYRTTRGNSAAYGLSASATTLIKKLSLDLAVENEAGQSYAAIANLLQMTNLTVSLAYLKSLDATLITALADSFTNITAINGPGVLSSGRQIPDANMANLCTYISATSPNAGNPCIKIGGTVYAFTIAS